MMRVLQVIPSVSPIHGGPSDVVRLLERGLRDKGIDCETATTDDDGPGRRLFRNSSRILDESGTVRWYFPKTTDAYKVSLPLAGWLLREVRGYDLIHVHAVFSFVSILATWAARIADVPYVVTTHGVLNRFGLGNGRALAKKVSMALLEGPALRNAAAVHLTSECERSSLPASVGGISTVVIPLGVPATPRGSAARFLERHPRTRSRARLLFLGRIAPVKNLEALLRAIALLVQQGLDAELLVAGSGEEAYVELLRGIAGAEGLEERVTWLGHVSKDEKADVLAAAELFILPSLSESFGMSVIEAMAVGLPCVVSSGVPIGGSIQAAGAGLVVGIDPRSIADGIAQFLADRDRIQAAGRAALDMAVAEYSLDAMATKMGCLYRSILEKRGRLPRSSCGSPE